MIRDLQSQPGSHSKPLDLIELNPNAITDQNEFFAFMASFAFKANIKSGEIENDLSQLGCAPCALCSW